MQRDEAYAAPTFVLSENGVDDWNRFRMEMVQHCFLRRSSQVFAEQPEQIPVRYPELDDFEEDGKTDQEKQKEYDLAVEYYKRLCIKDELDFQVITNGLWAGLRFAVKQCPWALDLADNENNHKN